MSHPHLRRRMPWLLLTLALLLQGCQSYSDSPALDTLRAALFPEPDVGSAALAPDLSYLRVVSGKRVAYVALGYVDPHPNGGIEVWYSASREVLRLQNGRVVGLTGSYTEWQRVLLPRLPLWSELLRSRQPLEWQRERDVMPGHRFGVQDRLLLRPTAAPPRSNLAQLDSARLAWFEERLLDAHPEDQLPSARYAVDAASGQVVYGEQCLSTSLCISWQRWRARR